MLTSQVQIIMPPHVNGKNRLFGGQLMAWIDVVAAVEARRHARSQVTTVQVDNLVFLAPAFLDDVIRLEARVTRTWRTSLEVRVDSCIETMDGAAEPINRAYLVFVALGDDDKPREVEPFVPQTDDEREEWRQAQLRREMRR
ncbi:acyl-CoA thioesterase [Clostridia bacterium]|nr:acyl-CoA thioesterase [Clostridia bacterium]